VRVGIMWRHYRERGGIAVYTDAIVRALLAQDSRTEYLLFVPPGARPVLTSPNLRVHEVAAHSRWTWDQWGVPAAAERERVDVVFNPKLSVPLRGRFRTAFALHGMEQFVHASSYPRLNRLYVRGSMTWYCRRADAIFSPSERVKSDIIERLGVPGEKIHVKAYGVADRFWNRLDPRDLERVRQRYTLPARFFLFVGGVTPLKNLPTLLRAMAMLQDRIPHTLVLSGFSRWKAGDGLALVRRLGLEDRVMNVGWVDDADQPALYQLATGLLFPSLYEGFGFPVVEAMASGCPVVTSTGGSLPEVAGDAALIVDPNDVQSLADAARRIAVDNECAQRLIELGYQRARRFRWDHVATLLRETFEGLVSGPPAGSV
jgi:glycosyltransferase involved in cell wall biosynthesis